MQIYLLLLLNITFGCFLLAYVYYKKEPSIHKKIDSFRQSRRENRIYNGLMENKYDISELPVLKDKSDMWYSKYHVVAHGGGAIDGKINTNSKEAWEAAYGRGVKLFDVDINRSSDGYYVLRHSWEDNFEQTSEDIIEGAKIDWLDYDISVLDNVRVFDRETFSQLPVYSRYTPQTIEDMFVFMEEHPDVYVISDIKLSNEFDCVYAYIFEWCKRNKREDILNRIIISAGNETQIKQVRAINPKVELSYRVYSYPNNIYEAIKLCIDYDIHVCMLSQRFAKPDVVELFTEMGIKVFVSVLNYESQYKYYQSIGASGCLSDYLYERR